MVLVVLVRGEFKGFSLVRFTVLSKKKKEKKKEVLLYFKIKLFLIKINKHKILYF